MAYKENEKITTDAQGAQLLYKDEQEFNENFEEQMLNPAIITNLETLVSIEEIRMSFSDFPIELNYEHASFPAS